MGRVQGDVQKTHPLQVHLEDRDIRAQALGHAGGVDARRAAAQHHDLARQHAGHAAEQHPAAAKVLGQKIAAHEHAHATGDFAHGLQQRQPAVDLNRFIGDAGDARFHQRLRQRPVRGQMQIGEQHLPGPEQRIFLGQRLLDLDDQVRPRKHLPHGPTPGSRRRFRIRRRDNPRRRPRHAQPGRHGRA